MIFADNSRRSAAEKCMRLRWLKYELDNRGVEKVRRGKDEFPLLTGTGVHTVVESLLQGADIDLAVNTGFQPYHSFVPDDERGAYLASEQGALIEALGRAWHATKYTQFVETYEVLDIEREEQCELAPGLVWMSRPDLLVRRRADGALFIVNLKTTKRADERWQAQWPIDMQTLSEVVAVEARLNSSGQKCESLGERTCAASVEPLIQGCAGATGGNAVSPDPIKLSGVIILGLIKGEQLEYPKGSGWWYHNNPLIWAWHNESGKAHPRGEWSARYEWSDEEGNHRLGRGWMKREVWLRYPGGVRAWVEHLMASDPALVEEQIVQLAPILRNEQQVEAWKDTVVYQEVGIRANRDAAVGQHTLDCVFPMATSAGNCLWPRRCEMFPVCFENVDPHDEQFYRPRTLNHPQEVTTK